jgi:phosphoribosylformylglycinamidine synthase
LIKFAPQYNKLHNNDSFFENQSKTVFAVQTQNEISAQDISKLNFFCRRTYSRKSVLTDFFVDSVPLWLLPWSTNAVEITQNMGFLELLELKNSKVAADFTDFDPMLLQKIRNYIKIYL